MKREEVFKVLSAERDYQDVRWAGTKSSQRDSNTSGSLDRTIDEFGAYIVGYALKLSHAVSETDDPKEKLNIIRKIGALAVACGEAHELPYRK